MEPANPSSTGGGGKNTQNVANSCHKQAIKNACMVAIHNYTCMHTQTHSTFVKLASFRLRWLPKSHKANLQ